MTGAAPRSVRAYLVGLALAIVLPLLAFSAFLVTRAASHEQALMEGQVRERAQATAMAISQMIGSVRSRLFGLANARTLLDGDFATFHLHLSEILQRQGSTVVLIDAAGRTVFSTAAPFGTPLANFPQQAGISQVANTGLAGISGFVASPAGGEPAVMVSVPVVIGGRVTHILSLDVSHLLAQTLTQQQLPEGWVATVIDRDGYIIARSRNPERYVGELGRLDAVSRVQSSDDGWFPYMSLDGVPMENAFTHVSLSGWGVIIGIPHATLLAPVRQSTASLILLGVCTQAIALLLAVAIGWRITRPIGRLVELAYVVGRGGRLASSATGLRETDRVAVSLREAGDRLAHSAADRDDAADALRESGERYRALAEELALANHERQTLLHLTVQGQEDERRRIARELHDGLGQYLTALRLGLTAMERSCQAGSDAPRQLASLKALTGDLSQALGRMAWEIRPTALDDLGLQKAITQYLEEWAERSELRIDQEVRIGDYRLPPPIETTLFRVVQEAIANVVKHAGADRVAVILDTDGTEVRLIIEDNGRGFPVGEGGAVVPGTHHLGLLGIRERLALVKGTLEVESLPGQGTTLYVRVPASLVVAA
jgi:signal transduction histidine kinase